jgi:hypothetical protein
MDLNGASVEDNPWAAEVIERYGALVCVLPYSGELPEDERETDVCTAGPSNSSSSDAGNSTPADLGDGG